VLSREKFPALSMCPEELEITKTLSVIALLLLCDHWGLMKCRGGGTGGE
jgi:hypothetical protein